MRHFMLVVAFSLGFLGQKVLADEGSYQLLKGNTKKLVGTNGAKNTQCAFVADEDAVYFNLRGTDLSQGVRAGYQELTKSFFGPKAFLADESNSLCH